MIFDTSLLTTMGVIFLFTLVASYLRSTRKDPCLASFEEYHVTLERADGKIVWGVLELEPTGLELIYRSSVQDEHHLETSYILYASEYGEIEAIFRFVDELSEENRQRRAKDIDRSLHPGPISRAKRSLRNFIGTASDSLSEMVGLLVGRAKKPAGRYITDTGESYLKKLGTNLLGAAGSAYDPLLEKHIGHKMVVEIMEGEEVHEHVGIFKNYSADFIEILDVQFPQKQCVEVGPEGCQGPDCLELEFQDGRMRVRNPGYQPVLLQSLKLDGEEEMLNVVVDGQEEVELFVEQRFQRAQLLIRVARTLDMVVPRTRCLIRHRAEEARKEILPELVFDMGYLLKPTQRIQAREKRLRQKLAANPNNALAAANLGGLLLQQRRYDEAEKWLIKALKMRRSLPDNGRRAIMQLRELRRKRDGESVLPRISVVVGHEVNGSSGRNGDGAGQGKPEAMSEG